MMSRNILCIFGNACKSLDEILVANMQWIHLPLVEAKSSLNYVGDNSTL